MGLYSFYRISKPSAEKVAPEKESDTYKLLRNRTFWGVTVAYSLYYVCRMSLSVVKQPLIDEGVLSAGQLGLIGSALLFVYAVGKFMNGFIADYCNIRRFMATGLFISALVNLLMGVLGWIQGPAGLPTVLIFISFAILWGINGWMQSMGSPPGVISLSRWFPRAKRGTYYSIFSATPYLGEFLSFIITGVVVGALGWQFGFLVAAIAGVIGSLIILFFVSDTPESKGLPSVQALSGETLTNEDTMPTKELQKIVLKHPGIWVIAISSAFIYITKYAISGWGVLFLQKAHGFSLEDATQIIAFSAAFGVLGTVLAFRQGIQKRPREAGCSFRNPQFHRLGSLSFCRWRLSDEYILCIFVQSFGGSALLHCRRTYGCGYSSEKGYRRRSWCGGDFKLCGCRSAGYNQRTADSVQYYCRGWCGCL